MAMDLLSRFRNHDLKRLQRRGALHAVPNDVDHVLAKDVIQRSAQLAVMHTEAERESWAASCVAHDNRDASRLWWCRWLLLFLRRIPTGVTPAIGHAFEKPP